MALGDAKSGRDVDPTLGPDSRLAFRRPGRQTHGAHRTQGIIFADAGTTYPVYHYLFSNPIVALIAGVVIFYHTP